MKKYKIIALFTGLFTIIILSGCLIESVNQPAQVSTGSTFTSTVTISEKNAETNPHKGILMVLVPNDWTFLSGTYQSAVGNGVMELNTDPNPVYGDIDTTIIPPVGMKWVDLISDQGYTHNANLVMETTVNFQVGTTTGTFPIGYASTKNTLDMLKSINQEDIDNDLAWTDTSMNHMVTITGAVSVEEELTGTPSDFNLSQNYPNPFNPSTRFTYSLKNSGDVSIILYDGSGNEIETLVNGFRAAGQYTINYNARNLASGIYYYRIVTPEFVQTNKMILIK
jgi:hypothetical protein